MKKRLRYKEAAERASVSVKTVKRWAGRGWIAVERVSSRCVLVLTESLDGFLGELREADARREAGTPFVFAADLKH